MPSKERSRGWCFTLNNWTDEDCIDLMVFFEECPSISYLIIGFEIAPKTKTKHIQGYMYFKDKKTFAYLKKCFGDRYRWDKQRAKKNVAAYCYCMEDGDYIEFGERPRQGHRTDLEVIKHDLLKKKPVEKIADEYFSQWCQYRRSFDEYIRIKGLSPKCETIIYTYDSENASQVKKAFEMATPKSYFVNYIEGSVSSVYHLYFSKKYDIIFIPLAPWVELLTVPYNNILDEIQEGDDGDL